MSDEMEREVVDEFVWEGKERHCGWMKAKAGI